MTAKRAALMGLPAPVKQAREPSVSRLIVKLRDSDMAQAMGSGRMQALATRAGTGMKTLRAMDSSAALMTLDAPARLSEAKAIAARLASDPMVEYATPDVMFKVQLTPSDVDFAAKQWHFFAPTANYQGAVMSTVMPPPAPKTAVAAGAANLETAWDTTTGSNSVVVAVIDTGMVNHPDLNNLGVAPFSDTYVPNPSGGRFLPGYDFVSNDAGAPVLPAGFVENDADADRDNDPSDPGNAVTAGDKNTFPDECDDGIPGDTPSNWHGAHTAGIIAATANNTLAATVGSVAGIGFGGVRILPVRALGKCGGALSDIVDAINWSIGQPVAGVTQVNPVANRPQIISLNFGGILGDACPAPLQAIINFAIANNITFIAPTGNDGEFELRAPANCVGVISVTSHAINGENSSFSNIGPPGAGAQPTISAAGGGSPASLGALGPIDDPDWFGYYIWSTGLCGTTDPLSTGGCTVGTQAGPGVVPRRGTSAAAAQVVGVAALIKTRVPNATPLQVSGALTTSARPFPDLSSCAPGRVWGAGTNGQPARCGIGMLDATRALQSAGPPLVLTPPRAVSVNAGQPATFTIEAIGAANYQWTRAGAPIPGATTASYTTGPTAAGDNNVPFAVVMTNSFGTSTSPAAVLTVVSASSNSPSGGGALPLWQLLLLAALMLASRVRIAQRQS